MATVTAPSVAPRGTVTAPLVARYKEIFAPDGFMYTYNVERSEQIELLGLSLIAGLDPLFLGPPGTGKTWMIELLLMLLDGAREEDFFNTLVFKETPADDILGPRSLPAMKQGEIKRLVDGYLPTSVVAYLDEIFKSSPTLVNSLLDLFANRKLKVGRNILSCKQLLCIFASSNELPDREDMQAFRDRFGLTNFVPPVKSPEGRKRVMVIQDEHQAGGGTMDLTDAPRLTLDEVHQIRTEVSRIIIPDPVREVTDKAQERWAQEGFEPSQRRIGQIQRAMKARAWARGDGEVSTDDIIIGQHMAWNHPDHAKKAHDVVMEFANVFARKAARAKEALDPIIAEVDELRKAVAEAGGEITDAHDEAGYKISRRLRSMRKETDQQIGEGKAQGHDTRDLEAVLDEIKRVGAWVEKTMMGKDDDA